MLTVCSLSHAQKTHTKPVFYLRLMYPPAYRYNLAQHLNYFVRQHKKTKVVGRHRSLGDFDVIKDITDFNVNVAYHFYIQDQWSDMA